MRVASIAIGCAVLAGCAVGAPPGFSLGDQWTIPLVGSLEDGVLVAPVYIDDRGPYLFAIDPDAYRSVIDKDLANEIHPRGGIGPHVIDESDTQRPALYAEIRALRIGNLTVEQKTLLIRSNHTFDTAGRHIRGLIGRDVIADSLTFGFDRNAGLAYLTTQAGFHPPSEAATVAYDLLPNHVYTETPPPGRKLVAAVVDGQPFKLHVDLGGPVSQLRESLWPKAQLHALPVSTKLIDEVGTVRVAAHGTVAGRVAVGPIERGAVFFVGYDDRRWDELDIDGTLGLDFFRPFSVWANWDKQKLYLTARGAPEQTTTQRLARWNSPTMAACANLGCAHVELTDEEQPSARLEPTSAASTVPGMTTAPVPTMAAGAVLTIERDASAADLDLDLTLGATAPVGSTALPLLAVNLPRGVDRLVVHLGPEFAGATAQVLDASPFPRACASGGGCVQMLHAPR